MNNKKIVKLNKKLSQYISKETARQIGNLKTSKISDYGLKAGEFGRVFYVHARNKLTQMESESENLNKFLTYTGLRKKYKKSNPVITKLNKLKKRLPILTSRSSKSPSIEKLWETLNYIAKVGLHSALVDTGIVTVDTINLLGDRKISKKDAIKLVLEEASKSAKSGLIISGKLALINAISSSKKSGKKFQRFRLTSSLLESEITSLDSIYLLFNGEYSKKNDIIRMIKENYGITLPKALVKFNPLILESILSIPKANRVFSRVLLISALAELGISSLKSGYLVYKGKLSNKDALFNIIKDASIDSTLVILLSRNIPFLSSISSILTLKEIALIVGANVVSKKLNSRL